jgi:hypothetical protein
MAVLVVAEATAQDSAAMKVITAITVLFLPATFLAVSSKAYRVSLDRHATNNFSVTDIIQLCIF